MGNKLLEQSNQLQTSSIENKLMAIRGTEGTGYFFLSLFSAILGNLFFVVFASIGVVRASKNKSFIGWFIGGCLLRAYGLYNSYTGYKSYVPMYSGYSTYGGQYKLDTEALMEQFTYEIVVFFILLVLFLIWAYHCKSKAAARAEMSQNEVEINDSVPDNKDTAAVQQQAENISVDSELAITALKTEQKVCSNCGASLVEGAKICRACGTPIEMPPDQVVPEKKDEIIVPNRCGKCGNSLFEGQRFCNKCGAPVEQLISAETLKSAVVSEPSEIIEAAGPAALDLCSLPAALRRAYIFIEDEEWDRAEEYLENVLDEDPENAYAYLGKAMAAVRIGTPTLPTPNETKKLLSRKEYARAKRFADADLSRIIKRWEKEANAVEEEE